MGPHVSGHRAALRKSTIAHRTFERLLSTVCAKMSSQVSGLREGLLTYRTLVWFFSRMRAKMSLQGRLASICLTTDVARVVSRKWFIPTLQVGKPIRQVGHMYGSMVSRRISYSGIVGHCWLDVGCGLGVRWQ